MRRQSPLAFVVLALIPPTAIADEAALEYPAKVRVERNVPFGKGGNVTLELDLARPEGDGPFPAVVCLHGGAWRAGSRAQLSQISRFFTERSFIESVAAHGYVAAAVSYRLAPGGKFPDQLEDCKAAVRWLRANAAKYGIDPARVGAVGFSAGGHLACLLGTTAGCKQFEGNGGCPNQPSNVQCVVSFFGPTDLTERTWNQAIEDAVFVPFLGATSKERPEVYKAASPVTYAARGAPPFLFLHGTEDKVVDIRQSRKLCSRLKELGVPAELVEVSGAAHGWSGEPAKQSMVRTVQFLDGTLKK